MNSLSDDKIRELEKKANEIRITIIEALLEAGSGHTAGPLGMTDIFTLLFFHVLDHDPKHPDWPERDRLVLSNGHICPVLYATMAHAGYASVDEYKKTLRKLGTKFQGHPHREFFPALETSSGPLGSGLSQATGMALAERIDSGNQSKKFVYCLMSDGEIDAGNTWEGAMLAGKEGLWNLIAIVDRNNIQIDGFTENIMPLEPLQEKWESFNWHVQQVDGHSFRAVNDAIAQAQTVYGKPSVIIAHTIPGKGVTVAERDYRYHGSPPGKWPEDGWSKEEQGKRALDELRTLGGKITGEHE